MTGIMVLMAAFPRSFVVGRFGRSTRVAWLCQFRPWSDHAVCWWPSRCIAAAWRAAIGLIIKTSLPTAWTGGAGVEHGEDTTYKHLTPTHLDMCREGGLCAGSKLLATRELEDIRSDIV